MRIAMLQLNFTVGDLAGNAAKILKGYRRAVHAGANLVVTSELSLCGYPPRDLLERHDFLRDLEGVAAQLEKQIGETGLIFGAPSVNPILGKPLYNSAFFGFAGRSYPVAHKTLLPEYDVFDESRYFEPYYFNEKAQVKGVFAYRGEKWGVLICEDLWREDGSDRYRVDTVERLARVSKHDLSGLIVLNASPWHYGKALTRLRIAQSAAGKLGCPLFYVNQVGGNDELVFDGRSFAIDSRGNCLSLAKAFKEDLAIVDLSPKQTIYYPIDGIPDIYDALVMGIRDYLHKCGFEKAVIGLSGGIDSAVTLCLAVAALGADNVTVITMPGPFSSPESVYDSIALVNKLDVKIAHLKIDPVLRAYQELLGPVLTGVALENIQARIRGNILMAVSNKEGSLVLSTGNKSEMAVGYCTLYGDMCGGLSVLSDVPKTVVYKLAAYINRRKKIIPTEIINKPPSAELRPDQKDQDDLPPYDILDDIIRQYVEESKTPVRIIDSGHDAETVAKILKKIDGNEYKRRQAAPGLKVTGKAFGSGRRVPIAMKHN